MSLVASFGAIAPHLRLKAKTYRIDNWVFWLHYRVTFCIFLACTLLVCSRQYIGEHINCLVDGGVPQNVINTYCFFTTTFTVIRDLNSKLLDTENIPHPGVGAYGFNSTEPIRVHAYYQWVPFVLFGQGLMFYLTHLLWKKWEGGRIRTLVEGLSLAAFSLEDKPVGNIPSREEKEAKLKTIRKAFIDRLYINGSWSICLIFCEVLNLLNVILQVIITNKFLSGQFYSLGSDIMREGLEPSVDVLEEVFPKVTKCTFHKYGPSGSIQLHDAMCVMALNIINEKIYTFLWFWFLFLFICSGLGLVWRGLTIVLHARSRDFNKIVFAHSCPGKLNPWNVLSVSRVFSYTDWLFLSYLAKNTDGMVFREIMLGLAEELQKVEPSKESLLLDSENGSVSEFKME